MSSAPHNMNTRIPSRSRLVRTVVLRQFAKVVLAILLGGIAGAALARYSAGFGIDEREMDARRSSASIENIRQSRSEGAHFAVFCLTFFRGMVHGELGYSTTLNRPVADLIRERMHVTVEEIGEGLALAIVASSLLAGLAAMRFSRLFETITELAAGVSLCLPVAILGYLCLLLRVAPFWAVAACTFPHLFRYTANLLEQADRKNHVVAARARGVSRLRLHIFHRLLPCVPELLATFSLVVSIAFGAAVPIEFATETPGLGQLAWQAASSRDLALLCVLTMFAAALVLSASGIAEVSRVWCFGERGID